MALIVPRILLSATVLVFATAVPSFAQTSPAPTTSPRTSSSPGGAPAGPGAAARQACRQEAMTFCKGIQPGGGRIMQCLQGHSSELSSACATAMSHVPVGASRGGLRGSSLGGTGTGTTPSTALPPPTGTNDGPHS